MDEMFCHSEPPSLAHLSANSGQTKISNEDRHIKPFIRGRYFTFFCAVFRICKKSPNHSSSGAWSPSMAVSTALSSSTATTAAFAMDIVHHAAAASSISPTFISVFRPNHPRRSARLLHRRRRASPRSELSGSDSSVRSSSISALEQLKTSAADHGTDELTEEDTVLIEPEG
ncbi:hypothetical protein RND81_09G051300 [Saponaria officinalis]|uniref:Uncharacterized protein n=1 Tax=Saponaria officinalis TaxID=3572 RepID=A0AAW1IIT7_SAPOF